MHISMMVSDSAALRPILSEYMPSRVPPSGRMKNPTLNVPSDSSSEVSGLATGKKSFAMMAANTPYSMKLYHSSPLPITAAATARGPVIAIGPPRIATCRCMLLLPSRAGSLNLDRHLHLAQIRLAYERVLPQLGRAAGQHHLAGLQHIGPMRDGRRNDGVLLHHEDSRTLLVDLL